MRTGIAVVLAFAIGAAATWLMLASESHPAPEPTSQSLNEESDVENDYREIIGRLQDERNRLASENDELNRRLAQLESERAAMQRDIDGAQRTLSGNSELTPPDSEQGATDLPTEAMREERRAEFEARRQEFAARIDEFMNERFASIEDPQAIERLNAVLEWQEYQRDLRRQFRDAESDEERAAIRAEMETARYNAESIVSAQQDDLIRDLAESYNVPPEERDAFVAGMRDVLADPFFEMEPMLTGGGFGPGGPRGGPGRFWGRGGRGN